MKQFTINGYKRVSKAAARKAYNAGQYIYMAPCNMRIGTEWYNCPAECKADGAEYAGRFDYLVTAFEFYNCHGGAGNYAAFYVKETEE